MENRKKLSIFLIVINSIKDNNSLSFHKLLKTLDRVTALNWGNWVEIKACAKFYAVIYKAQVKIKVGLSGIGVEIDSLLSLI